ncbi:MAG TPA: glycosyl hydrolase family 28 protein [Ferruginibacter sp.]|nr:glycosyl hydrolase family 28 protein [Ferruginibacter sp.]
MMKRYCFFYFLFFAAIRVSAQTYNILDYGAVADGKTINTKAIQAAIDQCARTGGEVIVPAGIFETGTLYIKSNVTIYLTDAAKILGSPSFADYPDNEVQYKNFFTHFPDGSVRTNKALLFAEGMSNITITGKGTIDGNGASKAFDLGDDAASAKSKERPCTILFINCKKVTVTNIHLTDPAYWLENYIDCDGLLLKGLNIYNHSNTNVDGMDIDSRNVTIDSCTIDSDDDAICFKSHSRNNICENIIVRNCTIASNCNAIKFGTTSIGGFKNINISHCVIHRSAESPIFHWQKSIQFIDESITAIAGIAIEITDGGIADSITISGITMNDVQTPIFLFVGNRGRKQVGDTTSAPVGEMKNITIKNIIATSHSKMASSITALPGHYIENVLLENIAINGMGGGDSSDAKIILPEKPTAYPENRMYGQVYPASGLYIRHAINIRLNNVHFTMRNKDLRPLIITDDTPGYDSSGVQFLRP